ALEDAMDTLIFSQTAIFRMQQLASCVYHNTGHRHRMATQEGMLGLLKEAATSIDKDIRHYFDAFLMELNKRQINMLEAQGVKMRKPFATSSSAPALASTITSIRKAG